MSRRSPRLGVKRVYEPPELGDGTRMLVERLWPRGVRKDALELNAWLKDYCAKNNIVYLDYFSALVDDKGMLKKDLADDGLHPNAAGFKVMAPLAEAAVEKAMK